MRVNYLFFVLLFLLMASCRTTKHVVSKEEFPVITENRLLKNIENNALDYNTLFAKRIDVVLNSETSRNSFRASLKIQRDSFMQISVTAPLGIEIARILLTKDSVKFVDMFNKRYFISSYRYFYEKYDVKLNYSHLQNIFTNTFFNFNLFTDEVAKNRKYKLDRTDSAYQLSTLEEKVLSRKMKKLYKKRKKNKEFVLILQKILIDPQTFRPLLMSVEEVEEEMKVSVNYKNVKDFSGKMFPERIVFDLVNDNKKTSLELNFQKLEFDIPVESNLRISSRYKRIE